MEIYIEDFLIQNTIINLCLLRLVQITTKTKSNTFKLMLASVVGAAFSSIAASALTNSIAINLLKLVCAIFMIKICFKGCFKQFITHFALLFAYTFALCGAVILVCQNAKFVHFGIATNNINLWFVMLGCLVFSYLFEFVAKHIKLKMQLNNLVYEVKLTNKNNSLKINAYLDTGNMLNIEGKPVLILDLTSYLTLTKQTYLDYVLKPPNTADLQLQTVAGSASLKLDVLDNVEIYINGQKKIFKNQIVAINNVDKFSSTNYQALLSPEFL